MSRSIVARFGVLGAALAVIVLVAASAAALHHGEVSAAPYSLPGKSGPPDGIVAASDAQLAFAQFKLGYRC